MYGYEIWKRGGKCFVFLAEIKKETEQMSRTLLDRMNLYSVGKKTVYKFEDGKLVKEFQGTNSAAYDAGITASALCRYINKKDKKPRKIPANVEYSYSALESKLGK